MWGKCVAYAMSMGRQSTFIGITIEEGKFGEDCRKVMAVKDGEKITCDNTGKFKIEKGNGETDYRCGMHINDYGGLGPEGTYEELDLE